MIQANIDEKMDENQRDAYSVGYSEGFDVGFQKGREDTIKHLSSFTNLAIKIFIITSIIIVVIALAAMSVKGQDTLKEHHKKTILIKKANIDSLRPGKSDVPNKKPGSIYGPGTLSYYEATTPINEINQGKIVIVGGEYGGIHPGGDITLVPIDTIPDNYQIIVDTIYYKHPIVQDTTPLTLLVRIQGKPWAFFHDGYEVKMYRMNDFRYFGGRHLLYLDSRKRPIRKEWVVYDKYSRQ